MNIRKILHEKRLKTEDHIRELERAGTAGERYTATMPDIPFLILALLCDIGWIIQLIAGGIRLHRQYDTLLCVSMVMVIIGVGTTIYLNQILEKEITTRFQKDMSFGLTVAGGALGGIAGVLLGDPWVTVGGFLNLAAGMPLYLSFKPGIRYGIQ